MSYATIDWEQERPSAAEVSKAWSSLSISPVEKIQESLRAISDALEETHTNGWAIARQFDLSADPVLGWYFSRNRLSEANFYWNFFSNPAVVQQFEMVGNLNDKVDDYEQKPSFTAIGDLASCISSGGAYKRFSGTDEEVHHLVTTFIRECLGFRVSSPVVEVNWSAWATGFCDVAWDGSILFFDRQIDRVTVLLFTDTD